MNNDTMGCNANNSDDIFYEKLEKALRIYKISELYLKDVQDDYGKLKIARLRLDFARHDLFMLMDEAAGKGINPREMDIFKDIFTFENNEPPDSKND